MGTEMAEISVSMNTIYYTIFYTYSTSMIQCQLPIIDNSLSKFKAL